MSDVDLDPIARDARDRRRRILLAVLVVVVGPVLAFAAFIGWHVHEDTVAQRAEDAARYAPHEEDARILQTIQTVRVRLVEVREAWPRATAPAALAALAPSTAPCPLRLSPPTEKAALAYVRDRSTDPEGFGNLHFFEIARPGDPINDGLGGRLWSLKETEKQLQDRGAWRSRVVELDAWSKSLGEYVFVVGRSTPPTISGPAGSRTFTPGHIEGIAYLFSYDQRRVVCAAPVSVSNSDQLEIIYEENGRFDPGFVEAMAALDRDLHVKAMTALARSARAVEAR